MLQQAILDGTNYEVIRILYNIEAFFFFFLSFYLTESNGRWILEFLQVKIIRHKSSKKKKCAF